jgi:hypothetical protein
MGETEDCQEKRSGAMEIGQERCFGQTPNPSPGKRSERKIKAKKKGTGRRPTNETGPGNRAKTRLGSGECLNG